VGGTRRNGRQLDELGIVELLRIVSPHVLVAGELQHVSSVSQLFLFLFPAYTPGSLRLWRDVQSME
jgi:hypothetical protein